LQCLFDAGQGGLQISALRAEPEAEVPVHLEMVAGDDEDAFFMDEFFDELSGIDFKPFSIEKIAFGPKTRNRANRD
jgi:hypothetical protein